MSMLSICHTTKLQNTQILLLPYDPSKHSILPALTEKQDSSAQGIEYPNIPIHTRTSHGKILHLAKSNSHF